MTPRLIINADDFGWTTGQNQGTILAYQQGVLNRASLLCNGEAFDEAVKLAAQNSGLGVGVHLTLNSEWDGYRWGPISTRDPTSGLMDEEGYLHREQEAVHQQADPAAVQTELAAQVARALAGGIDVTHIDTHMGTVAHPRFIPGYVQLAQQHNLPFLILRLDEAGWRATLAGFAGDSSPSV